MQFLLQNTTEIWELLASAQSDLYSVSACYHWPVRSAKSNFKVNEHVLKRWLPQTKHTRTHSWLLKYCHRCSLTKAEGSFSAKSGQSKHEKSQTNIHRQAKSTPNARRVLEQGVHNAPCIYLVLTISNYKHKSQAPAANTAWYSTNFLSLPANRNAGDCFQTRHFFLRTDSNEFLLPLSIFSISRSLPVSYQA